MITLRVPAIIDECTLRLALAVADKSGSGIQFETFFRLRAASGDCLVDCDTQKDVMDFVRESVRSAPSVDAVAQEPTR